MAGSDGHSLAVTENGEVFSWGDGDYGKLGQLLSPLGCLKKNLISIYNIFFLQFKMHQRVLNNR